MSEYKSPIKVTFEDISNEVINRYDDAIICIAKKITGIDVDKERLTNALLLDKKLVRCKDCRFWGTEQDGYCAAIDDPYMLETDADDFCSWGEKR